MQTQDADLADANLNYADLTNANFQDADLEDATLVEADLKFASFSGATVTNTNFDEHIGMKQCGPMVLDTILTNLKVK